MPIAIAPLRACLKSLLILLLVVAQLAAPLVHAHVGGELQPGSVHLPGMETLTALVDHASWQANDQAQELPGMVVGIATGLQNTPSHSLLTAAPVLLPASAPAIAKIARATPLGAFALPLFLASPHYRHALPRAPPVLAV